MSSHREGKIFIPKKPGETFSDFVRSVISHKPQGSPPRPPQPPRKPSK